MRFFNCMIFIITCALIGCKNEENRVVIDTTSPEGHAFSFMPIYEKGVTDITIYIAWPMDWAYRETTNKAVPFIGAQAILSGGTADITPMELMESFNDKNSSGSLTPTADYVFGQLSFPKEYREEVIKTASEMLHTPIFEEKWIGRIKEQITDNMARTYAQTPNLLWRVVRQATLGDVPVNDYLNLADPSEISAVDVSMLRRWHKETFTQSNLKISVTGAISREDAGRSIDQLLRNLPKGEQMQSPASKADFSPRKLYLHVPEAEKTTLALIAALPPTSDGKDAQDFLALSYFSQAGDKPLFEAMRTQLRASYGFQGGISNYDRTTRLFHIAGEVEAEKLNEAVLLLQEVYETYRTAPDLSDFSDLRANITSAVKDNSRYVDTSAYILLQLLLDGIDTKKAPNIHKEFENTTVKDIAERMRTVFPKADNLNIVAVGPNGGGFDGACVVTSYKEVLNCP